MTSRDPIQAFHTETKQIHVSAGWTKKGVQTHTGTHTISNQETVCESAGWKWKPSHADCYSRWEKQSRKGGKLVLTMQSTGSSNSTYIPPSFAVLSSVRVSSRAQQLCNTSSSNTITYNTHTAVCAWMLSLFWDLIKRRYSSLHSMHAHLPSFLFNILYSRSLFFCFTVMFSSLFTKAEQVSDWSTSWTPYKHQLTLFHLLSDFSLSVFVSLLL